jgi:hypothetical protein
VELDHALAALLDLAADVVAVAGPPSSRDRMSSSVLPFLSSRSISVFAIYDEDIRPGDAGVK